MITRWKEFLERNDLEAMYMKSGESPIDPIYYILFRHTILDVFFNGNYNYSEDSKCSLLVVPIDILNASFNHEFIQQEIPPIFKHVSEEDLLIAQISVDHLVDRLMLERVFHQKI